MIWFGLFVYCISCLQSYTNGYPQVAINVGFISGAYRKSYWGKTYNAFEGIPYAEPPVGDRRFKSPEKKSAWGGVWNANKPQNHCLQLLPKPLPQRFQVVGEEDCLYLNVYTPELPSIKGRHPNLDVIVFIHGGGFMFGAGSDYGPDYYIDRNFILVTMNYRVGILGFLTSGDNVLPGNNGLKDQNLALQWIQENIETFGGNKKSIILTGEASVSYHIISPKSQGLFHKAVSHSGTALDPWAYTENGPENFVKLAKIFQCNLNNNVDKLDCLKKVDGRAIAKLTGAFMDKYSNPFTPFGPIVEPDDPLAFLPEHPVTILKRGNITKIPYIIGVTSEDGLYPLAQFITNETLVEDLNDEHFSRFPNLLFYHSTVPKEKHAEVSKKVKEEYFELERITNDNQDKLIEMVTDRLYDHGGQLMARMYALYVEAPVYFYQFRYRGRHSYADYISQTRKYLGAAHGDDVCYLVTCPYFVVTDTDYDRKFLVEMQETFSSFYKTGKPKVPEPLAGEWEPVKVENGAHVFNAMIMENSEQWDPEVFGDLGKVELWKNLIGDAENLGVW